MDSQRITTLGSYANISACTKKYIETQLREPVGEERRCMMDIHCLCLSDFGFIMKEFVPEDNAERGSKPGLCYVCIRHKQRDDLHRK